MFNSNVVLAVDPPSVIFIPTFRATTPLVDRIDKYDYAPTAMVEDGVWKAWYCGEEIRPGVKTGESWSSGDSIYYWSGDATKTTSGPSLIFPATFSNVKENGQHNCAPTVVKHANLYIADGQELYKMYYECARRFWRGGKEEQGFTQICLATSQDGQHWQTYNQSLWDSSHTFGNATTDPSPVVKANPKILENIQYTFLNGRHTVGVAPDLSHNYGVGHPTAIVMNVGGIQQVWLWYYDVPGDWNKKSVFLVKSTDGIHFENPVKTTMPHTMDVKYFAIPTGNYPGYFVGTQGILDTNYFTYSFDGINWTWWGNSPNKEILKFGLAKSTNHVAYAQPAIVGDKHGIVHSSNVNILSGEGSSWPQGTGLWLIQGSFTAPIATLPARQGDFNNDNVVNLADFGVWKKRYLAVPPTMTLVDFGEWKREYLKN